MIFGLGCVIQLVALTGRGCEFAMGQFGGSRSRTATGMWYRAPEGHSPGPCAFSRAPCLTPKPGGFTAG